MATLGPGGADWEDVYTGDGSDTEPLDRLMLADALKLRPGDALDLGCGGGGDAIGLAQRGWNVTGVDSSPKSVRSANISAQRAGVRAQFLRADFGTWRPTGLFDLVISLFALPPPGVAREAVLALARQSLAPGGLLVVGEWERIEEDGPYVTVEELSSSMSNLEIVRAESVNADPEPVSSSHGQGRLWPAVLLTARRPI